MSQPIVDPVPERRVRTEVGTGVTDAGEDRRYQAHDGRYEEPHRALRQALVRPHEERAHEHRLENEKGDREVDQERMPLRPRRGDQCEERLFLPWWMPSDAASRDLRGRRCGRCKRPFAGNLRRDPPQLLYRLIAEER